MYVTSRPLLLAREVAATAWDGRWTTSRVSIESQLSRTSYTSVIISTGLATALLNVSATQAMLILDRDLRNFGSTDDSAPICSTEGSEDHKVSKKKFRRARRRRQSRAGTENGCEKRVNIIDCEHVATQNLANHGKRIATENFERVRWRCRWIVIFTLNLVYLTNKWIYMFCWRCSKL